MCPIERKDCPEDPCDQQLLHWMQESPADNNFVPVLSYESLLDCNSFLRVAVEHTWAK